MVVNSFCEKQNLRFDINLFRFKGSLLWDNLPLLVTNCQSLHEF